MHTRPDAQDSPDAALALRGGLPDQHAAWAFLRWYAAPGLLMRHDGGEDLCWLHVHARTAEELTAFREAYPADWVC
ncbi:hypothetical protein [Kitasatospora sp. NPDC048407]|uniref:hypothetical protein n=1 Tax=Kitasatospora sp. NPDC048407 TaxID=3364051 RepID=UPI003721D0E6